MSHEYKDITEYLATRTDVSRMPDVKGAITAADHAVNNADKGGFFLTQVCQISDDNFVYHHKLIAVFVENSANAVEKWN